MSKKECHLQTNNSVCTQLVFGPLQPFISHRRCVCHRFFWNICIFSFLSLSRSVAYKSQSTWAHLGVGHYWAGCAHNWRCTAGVCTVAAVHLPNKGRHPSELMLIHCYARSLGSQPLLGWCAHNWKCTAVVFTLPSSTPPWMSMCVHCCSSKPA